MAEEAVAKAADEAVENAADEAWTKGQKAIAKGTVVSGSVETVNIDKNGRGAY